MKSGISVGGLLKSSGFRAGPPGSQLPAQVSSPDLPDGHCNQGRGGSSRGGSGGQSQGQGVRRRRVQQRGGAGYNAQGQVGSGWWDGARVRGGVRGGVKGVARRGGVIPASDMDAEGTGACIIS